MEKIELHNKSFHKYISYEEIDQAMTRVAAQLDKDLAGEDKPLFISTLNGAFMFTADLLKKLHLNLEVTFVKVSSYQGTKSVGTVRQSMGLCCPVAGRTVIILEDIVDTGTTIEALYDIVKRENPKSIRVCTLLFKPSAYTKKIPVDYVVKEIPNAFIVGYGLDYDQLGRQYKDIYVIDE